MITAGGYTAIRIGYKGGKALVRIGQAANVAAGVVQTGRGISEISEGKTSDGILHISDGLIRAAIGAKGLKSLNDAKILALQVGCFAAGTLVYTNAGWKQIEEIREGDLVLSSDEDGIGDTLAYKKVTVTHQRLSTVMELRVAGETLRLTKEHPVYVVAKGWTPSAEVQIGDRFISSTGQIGLVEAINLNDQSTMVYNLTIEDYHTFYVSETGRTNFWVHNTPPECQRILDIQKQA